MKTGILLSLCLAVLAGCASDYRIQTVDGETFTTRGEPVISAGAYRFIDQDGEQHSLDMTRVKRLQAL